MKNKEKDIFYSEANQKHLKESIEELKSGKVIRVDMELLDELEKGLKSIENNETYSFEEVFEELEKDL